MRLPRQVRHTRKATPKAEHQRLLCRRRQRRVQGQQARFVFCLALLGAIALSGGYRLKGKPWLPQFSSHPSAADLVAQSAPLIPQKTEAQSRQPMEQAMEYASSAASLNQSAYTLNDWQLVTEQWQYAIAALKTVPQTDAHYQQAQQKIKEYQENLTYAQKQIAQRTSGKPISTFYLPAIKPVSLPRTALTCSSTDLPATEQVPLAMTQMQSYSTGEGKVLVGCITNRSRQILTHVGVTYQAKSDQNSQFFQGGFSYLSVTPLRPGETAPFRSEATVSSQATQLHLTAIYWKLEKEKDMQGVSASKSLAF